MIADRYRGRHSSSCEEAVHAFEEAVFAVAAHRPAATALNAALDADEDLVAALALKGLGVALLGKSEDFCACRDTLLPAQAALRRADGGTSYERTLVEALELVANGSLKAAAARLESRVQEEPRDFFCLKLSNALRFMTGQPNAMLQTTALALGRMDKADSGYGFTLGLHAFGLEETGEFSKAEAVGRTALANQPADIWGIHAVCHVLEMRGRVQEGAEWLESSRPLWPLCNNFNFHMAWHLALFHLESANYETVLELYDREVRPVATDDFRDMSNAVSMLWRLEQEGVDVGDRWQGLHAIAHRRRNDTTYVFASLHYLLALLGAGDIPAARELVFNLRQRALAQSDGEQALVAANVGVSLAETIMELHASPARTENLTGLSLSLPAIGGSRAQRDVFMRSLLMIAANSGDAATYDVVMRVRSAMKKEDRFMRLTTEHLSRVTGGNPGQSKPKSASAAPRMRQSLQY